MAEYDQFEKIFCGTWKQDRDEKMEELMDHLKTPEEDKKFVLSMKPTLTLTRSGNSILQKLEIAPGTAVDTTMIFGQEYEAKDPSEPIKWHSKSTPTFDGKVLKQIVVALMPPPKNIDYMSLSTVTGDELTLRGDGELQHELIFSGLGVVAGQLKACMGVTDHSVVGKRIFKRVN